MILVGLTLRAKIRAILMRVKIPETISTCLVLWSMAPKVMALHTRQVHQTQELVGLQTGLERTAPVILQVVTINITDIIGLALHSINTQAVRLQFHLQVCLVLAIHELTTLTLAYDQL